MRRVRHSMTWLAAIVLAIGARSAHADGWVAPFQGHVAFGYAKLFTSGAPGGSLAFSVGIDHPLAGPFRAGIDLDYALLGTRTIERGSLVADVDYSTIEALGMLQWKPSWPGPVGRISAGAGVMGARAAVSSSGAAEFQDLPVSDLAPALALEVTLMSKRPAPVAVGIETGVHTGFVPHDTWTVWDLRFAIHY